LESEEDPFSLFDIVCDVNSMIITVSEICKSGSYSGVNWEKTFLDSDENASSPENNICLGEGDENKNLVYSIPLTKKSYDPANCNMIYETNQIADTHTVFLNFIINEDRISNFTMVI
jgi:hypothetical protein